jgi:hypothetical protein
LLRRDDTLTATYTGPDAWASLAQAREYVRDRRTNALTHETAHDGHAVAAHLRAYRQSQHRYLNALSAESTWTATPALREAIEDERERPWTPHETADFLRAHRKLQAELSGRWTARLDQILAQTQPYLDRKQEHAHFPQVAREAEEQLEAGA